MSIQIQSVSKTGQHTQNLETIDHLGRRVWLTGEVNEDSAKEVIVKLEHLASLSHEPIRLYINSGGGEAASGFAVIDAMRRCPCPVHTVATGLAASIAALIFAAGDRRLITPMAEVMLHQPWSSLCDASASDFERVAAHINQTKNRCTALISQCTGRSVALVEQDISQDFFLTADGAVNYGIADEILKGDKYDENDL